jgi:hypothetical protein
MEKKRIHKRIILITILTVVVIGSSVISYETFGVYNPVASAFGLLKVTLTDSTSCEVQNVPKVIIIKPNYSVIKAMEEHGYVFIKEEQMGSMLVFEKDGVKYRGIGNGGRISFFRCKKF